MPKVLLVVDVSNLYYCTRTHLGSRIDYLKLRLKAANYGEVYRAIAYGSSIEDQAAPFIGFLINNGYEAKYKSPKIQLDGSMKADWDLGIAMDVVRMVDLVDVVIIASADGDLVEVVRWVQERGRRVVVIGCALSRDLVEVANEAIEIKDYVNEFVVNKQIGPADLGVRQPIKSDSLQVTSTASN